MGSVNIKVVRRLISLYELQITKLKRLLYYDWLEQHGIVLEQIAGCTDAVPLSPTVRHELRKQFGEEVTNSTTQAINFKMKDGSTKLLPWPPFPREVIFVEREKNLTAADVQKEAAEIAATLDPDAG